MHPDEGRHARGFCGGLFADSGKFPIEAQDSRAGVLQDECNLLGAQHGVDGHENQAARGQRVAQTCKYGAIARDDRDPIPALQPKLGETARHPNRQRMEFPITPRRARGAYRYLVGQAQRRSSQQVGDALAAGCGNEGCAIAHELMAFR